MLRLFIVCNGTQMHIYWYTHAQVTKKRGTVSKKWKFMFVFVEARKKWVKCLYLLFNFFISDMCNGGMIIFCGDELAAEHRAI